MSGTGQDRSRRPSLRFRLGFGFWFGALWLATLVFLAITSSWLPIDPNKFDLPHALRPPSWSHPFGTTRLGEDVFAICVHGTRVALTVGFGAAAIVLIVGAPLGMTAGYFGGATDRIVTIGLDALMAVPTLILALTLVIFIGQSVQAVVLIIGVLLVPRFARIARSATMAVAERDFVRVARLTGARHLRVLLREIGPNIAVPLVTYLLLLAGGAMLIEGALSFLGLGAPLDKASWGRLVAGGRDELQRAWWWSMCPSAVIFLTVLSLNLVQDGLQRRWLGVSRRTARGGRGAPTRLYETATRVRSPSSRSTLRRTGTPPVRPVASADPGRPSLSALQVIGLHTYLSTPFGVVRAVDGVSVRVERGQMLAIVGESGAGKTMLARSILGIAPPTATIGGQVLLDGTDLRALSGSELRQRRGRDISIVLQDPMTSLSPVMRVGHQITELVQVHLGVNRREARRRAVQLLSDVGIAEPARRARQYPHQLSGGQRQRVAIALALSCDPKVLIADEPTSALDVIVQAQILDLIDRLRRDHDLAVVLITHDLPLALTRADEVAVMYAGRIVEQAPTAQLANGPRMPYASALFAVAPRISAPSHARCVPIPGRPPSLTVAPRGCAFAPRCAHPVARCWSDAPVLETLDKDHLVACWGPIDVGSRRPPPTTGRSPSPNDSATWMTKG